MIIGLDSTSGDAIVGLNLTSGGVTVGLNLISGGVIVGLNSTSGCVIVGLDSTSGSAIVPRRLSSGTTGSGLGMTVGSGSSLTGAITLRDLGGAFLPRDLGGAFTPRDLGGLSAYSDLIVVADPGFEGPSIGSGLGGMDTVGRIGDVGTLTSPIAERFQSYPKFSKTAIVLSSL